MYFNSPNSLDNKGSCSILKDFYCSVTLLRELGIMSMYRYTTSCIQGIRHEINKVSRGK